MDFFGLSGIIFSRGSFFAKAGTLVLRTGSLDFNRMSKPDSTRNEVYKSATKLHETTRNLLNIFRVVSCFFVADFFSRLKFQHQFAVFFRDQNAAAVD